MSTLSSFRVLAMPSGVGYAHLTRLVLIARALRERGAEVAFAFRSVQEPILKAEGFRTFLLAEPLVTDFTSNVYAAFTPATIEAGIADELRAIEAFQPHLILSDFRLTAAISARVASLPLVSVVNACLTKHFNPVTALASDEGGAGKGLAGFAAKAIQQGQTRGLAQHFRSAARQRGIRFLDTLYDFLAGDFTLLPDVPELIPLEKLPDSYRYVGPLVWEGSADQPLSFILHDPNKALLYATTGNTGSPALVEAVVGAFGGDERYQVVLTTGAFLPPADLTAPNIYAERFIPGSRVISKARAVLHSGGSGTTYQTLAHGVPAVVIPANNEQRIYARLLQKHGLGRLLAPAALTPARLREEVEAVMADAAMAQRLQAFKERLDSMDGEQSAADAIERILQGGYGQP